MIEVKRITTENVGKYEGDKMAYIGNRIKHIIYLIDAIHMINELVLLMMTGVVFLTSRSK